MDRRNLLLLGLALPLGACQFLSPPPLTIVCDPQLAPAMEKAARAWPGLRGAEVRVQTDISSRLLASMMDNGQGVVVATREEKHANRLQRTARVRLADRWKRQSAEGPVALLVTRGDYQVERQARKFAEWAASPEADAFFDRPGILPAVAGAV